MTRNAVTLSSGNLGGLEWLLSLEVRHDDGFADVYLLLNGQRVCGAELTFSEYGPGGFWCAICKKRGQSFLFGEVPSETEAVTIRTHSTDISAVPVSVERRRYVGVHLPGAPQVEQITAVDVQCRSLFDTTSVPKVFREGTFAFMIEPTIEIAMTREEALFFLEAINVYERWRDEHRQEDGGATHLAAQLKAVRRQTAILTERIRSRLKNAQSPRQDQ